MKPSSTDEQSKSRRLTMSEEMKQRAIKKGNKVIIKRDVPDIELSSRDVITNLDGLRGARDKDEHQIKTAESQIVKLKEHIENIKASEKDISGFENWARELQVSKLKSYVEECKAQYEKQVMDEEKHDEGATPEQVTAGRYVKYQRLVATHDKINKEIAPTILREHLFENSILENPWKK